jgi:hypothetical protein
MTIIHQAFCLFTINVLFNRRVNYQVVTEFPAYLSKCEQQGKL